MDETSSREPSPAREHTDSDPRKTSKEMERILREAEKHRRKLAETKHREQARAVMNRRQAMLRAAEVSGQA
ncbi:hypothetical protein DXG01_013476, partial [Tephrocybe rancida]